MKTVKTAVQPLSMVVAILFTVFGQAHFVSAQTAIRLKPATPIVPGRPLSAAQGPLQNLPPEVRAQMEAQALAAASGAAPAGATKASPRLTQTLALMFNRSPVAILKAWSQAENPAAESDTPRPPVPDPKAELKRLETESLKKEVEDFAENVTLGKWDLVKTFLAGFQSKDEADKAYHHLLTGLQMPPTVGAPAAALPAGLPPGVVVAPPGGLPPDDHVMSPADLIGLISASPIELKKEDFVTLGRLLSKVNRQGYSIEKFSAAAKAGMGQVGGTDPTARRNAAQIFVSASLPGKALEFLTNAEDAVAQKDVHSLMLLGQASQQEYSRKRKPELLEKAWSINQMILGLSDIDATDKENALRVAVELAPKVREELGQAWLKESFSTELDRGVQILGSIGVATADGQRNNMRNTSQRIEELKLQKVAVETLLEAAPEKAQQWKSTLNLLAQNWLKEAKFTRIYSRSSSRPQFRRDRYGNIFYANDDDMARMMSQANRGNRPVPIPTTDVLEIRPDGKWFDQIDESIKQEFHETIAQLHMKINEEDKAFPHIESVAKIDKKTGKSLVEEFLRVWIRNHNPNSNRQANNQYIYFFGFEQRANSIPLTRSKQQRNLVELQKWIERLRELDLEEIDEEQLVKAFTTCHSTAEVYRIEDIENVFGSIDNLKPNTIAGLAQKMRTNLSTSWRQPRVQETKKTNRKEPEIRQEVMRGYGVAEKLTLSAIAKTPDSWELQLAKACITFDKNAYMQEFKKSSDFTEKQRMVYGEFAKAAQMYADKVPSIEEDEQDTEVFDLWFYASLGSCDLALLTHEQVSSSGQFPKIKKAIEALPGEAPQSHMSQFANKLFTRMSPLKPEMKYRYLKGGFDIVEDHKDAWEARKVFDYYKDLVNEIELVTKVDGSDVVGQEAFGVFVMLRHTEEVERESGGFAKYLQNQNNMPYAFNYGRPTQDYRESFEKSTISALAEHFEVVSVTFEDEKNLESREAKKEGWRLTPYAYLLLKPRGKEVDLIPPIKLDLDFLDTSGYAVLPIESKAIPIVVGTETPEQRPMKKLEVTQMLDERRSGEGKLVLEVKATARGLIPDLKEIVDINEDTFEIIEVQDQGVSVASFDPESNDIEIVCEREWLIELKAAEKAGVPEKFTFCSAKVDDTDMKFQRYIDADLVDVEREISLENSYGRASRAWIYWLLGGIPAVLILGSLVAIGIRRPKTVRARRYETPSEITPLSVLSLLKQIQGDQSVREKYRPELDTSIEQLEQHFFYTQGDQSPDLDKICKEWLSRAN